MASRILANADARVYREEETTAARIAAQQNGMASANGNVQQPGASQEASPSSKTDHLRRRYVFTDPVAFRYLEEDPSTAVLERRGRLKGYELYAVEQWACSRVHPTFVITTYTGDQNHSVLVGVLGVPADEDTWSPRLRVYFKAVSQFHARPKETPLGMLMVTNLSSFPSALTVIPVPDGDIRKHREDFVVNENLKRLGCSGRSGLSLAPPASATQAKFHQLYKTSDRLPLYSAVIEMVKLCQVALMVFGKLEQEYADGLLCDITEKAINDWWIEIGSEYYNLEPSDGILGPTTVAGLLGMLMGARNRLNYFGAPVPKDVFDIASLKRGIAYFQKSQKLPRTRRLDRQTLDRLHRVTAKAAAGEGWAVPKAVKSTVAELSGKGGEMVMGMVGARDKAGISDIETLDIDRFISLLHGERSKWLWYGKPRRGGTESAFGKSLPDMGNMIFGKDENGGYVWSSKKSDPSLPEEDVEIRKKDTNNDIYSNRPPGSATSMIENPTDKDQHLRKTVFKSVTGKMSDARSGFGRIKDAVGLRGHTSRHSRDDSGVYDSEGLSGLLSPSSSILPHNAGQSPSLEKTFTWKNKVEDYQNGYPKGKMPHSAAALLVQSQLRDFASPVTESKTSLPFSPDIVSAEEPTKNEDADKWAAQVKEIRQDLIATDPSVAGSLFDEADLEGPLLEAERDPQSSAVLLRRRHSYTEASSLTCRSRHQAWWPRQLSFSAAEEAVLLWDDIGVLTEDAIEEDDFEEAMRKQQLLTDDLQRLHWHLQTLREQCASWVETQINGVETLDMQAAQDREEFQTLYHQLSEAYQAVKQSSQDLLSEERSHVLESIKDVEVLGAKLDYEINALVSKVEDVEDGVAHLERQIEDIEGQAMLFEAQLKKESWLHWAMRTMTGLGVGPQLPP
jgi:hypothetical protein